MEQITKRDGRIYYGELLCRDADDAYCRFRADYNASCGRQAFQRLGRIGQRTERIHGFGFYFSKDNHPGRDEFGRYGKVSRRILGLVGIHYCHIIGAWDIPEFTDEEFDRWIDWAFSRGSGAFRTVGRKDKSGRTSKRLKARYR